MNHRTAYLRRPEEPEIGFQFLPYRKTNSRTVIGSENERWMFNRVDPV